MGSKNAKEIPPATPDIPPVVPGTPNEPPKIAQHEGSGMPHSDSTKTSIAEGKLTKWKIYLNNRHRVPEFEGEMKKGFRVGDYTYKESKDQKHDGVIKMQRDLKGIRHPNINEINDIFLDKEKGKHIIVEKYYDRTLGQRLEKKEVISGVESAYIVRDCLKGLQQLKKYKRNHGSIMTSNIAYQENSNISKLTDFHRSQKFTKAFTQQLKTYDSQKLLEMVDQIEKRQISQRKTYSARDRFYFDLVKKRIQESKGKHSKALKQIEDQVILHDYKHQIQWNVAITSNVVYALNTFAKDIQNNGKTQKTRSIAIRQMIKAVLCSGVKSTELWWRKKQILKSVDNSDYRIGNWGKFWYMAMAETLKQLTNLAFQRKFDQQTVLESAKKVGLNLGEYAAYASIINYLDKNALNPFSTPITILNYGADTLSSTAGKLITLNPINLVVGVAVGTAFDVARGQDVKESVRRNAKTAGFSWVGSQIGKFLGGFVSDNGATVGECLGGLVGGILATWWE